MSTLTLWLVVLFTLYDGISSKITHKKVVQLGEWIDQKSNNFIKKFAFKSNKELFPILHKSTLWLSGASFILALLLLPLYINGSRFMTASMVALGFIALITSSVAQLISDSYKIIKLWLPLFGLSAIFYLWIYFNDKNHFMTLLQPLLSHFNHTAHQLQISSPTLITRIFIVLIGIFIAMSISYAVLRSFAWVLILTLKKYAKLCLLANEDQPLKPFYLLSKTIILIVSHFVTTP